MKYKNRYIDVANALVVIDTDESDILLKGKDRVTIKQIPYEVISNNADDEEGSNRTIRLRKIEPPTRRKTPNYPKVRTI